MNQDPIFAGEVADVFVLSGRTGVVVVPAQAWAVPIFTRAQLLLIRPDDSRLQVEVGGIEMANPPVWSGKCGILLSAEHLARADVRVGSTLWLMPAEVRS